MLKMKIPSMFVLLAMASQTSPAQTMPPTFSQHAYGILNYDLFVPSPNDTAKKYPLILYFHGYNDTVKKYFNWYDSSVQSINPCFVFAPKCPPSDGQGWGNSWQDLISPRLAISLEVLDSLIKNCNIDTNRLYVYGTSMGGYGTFEVLHRYPKKFAAAMVLCGGGNPATAPEVMQTPLWIFHGSLDSNVPISESRDLYDQMIALGATRVRFTEYPKAGHEMWSWAPKEPAWPDWIFNFSRGDTFARRPDIPIAITCTKMVTKYTYVNIFWNDADNRETRQNKIWYYKIIRNDSVIVMPDFTVHGFSDATLGKSMNAYTVTAVNYDFQESDSSNTVWIDNTTGIGNNEELFAREFALSQNYPNPFNPKTVISYRLPVKSRMSLKIYSILGREVATLFEGVRQTGKYDVQFEGSKLASGIYFYRLEANAVPPAQAGRYSESKKLLLLK
jgi:predicted esterase